MNKQLKEKNNNKEQDFDYDKVEKNKESGEFIAI